MNEHMVSILTPEQSKMARAGLGWGVRDLAANANVATHTITRFEAGDELKARTVEAIRAALEGGGATFIDNEASTGVAVRRRNHPQFNKDYLELLIARFTKNHLSQLNAGRIEDEILSFDKEHKLKAGDKLIGSLTVVDGALVYDPRFKPLSGQWHWPTELDLRHWVEQAWGQSVLASSM